MQIFWQFLWLGCISFGGPAAHIGYFRRMFVDQKQWLSAEDFASHLALSQFLPGPSSSQLAFAIACQRGGVLGGALAFVGFTLPSFLLMLALALLGSRYGLLESGLVQGLKLLAVVVVADAILSMAKQFCTRPATIFLALLSAALLLAEMTPLRQFALLLLGGLWMAWRGPGGGAIVFRFTLTARLCLLMFVLLAGLSLYWPEALFSQFFQAGSIVFGGGHVVLPLLESLLGGALDQDRFLLGYAAAQAVPGPMFSFASYLGAVLQPQAPVLGALIATLAVFLPGFLLLLVLQSNWRQMALQPQIRSGIAGVNAVAVGMLFSAWVDPVLSGAPQTSSALFLALLGLLALRTGRVPVLGLIALFAGAGYLLW